LWVIVLEKGDAGGVKAVQRDQGEARRSGVISRRLRRLAGCVRKSRENEFDEGVTRL